MKDFSWRGDIYCIGFHRPCWENDQIINSPPQSPSLSKSGGELFWKDELVTNCHRFETMKHPSVLPYVFTEHGVAMLVVIPAKAGIQGKASSGFLPTQE